MRQVRCEPGRDDGIDPIVNVINSHTAWRMLAALAVAEFFGMTVWFSATAVTPALIA